MTSAHAIRLYELLIQWGSIGKREIELKFSREALMLKNQYPSIKDLKQRVIDVGVEQINQHSDLTVEYTQRKTGRTVTHLTFRFGPKNVETPQLEIKPEAKPETMREPQLRIPRTKSEINEYIHANCCPVETWGQAENRLGVFMDRAIDR
ncbi:hypothetical protein CCP3SC1_2030001 [Gammaproteobacteria bacterium]